MAESNCERETCIGLVIQSTQGDLEAFDKLVTKFRPGSVMLARQILKKSDLADDAVQDAFISAFKALPQLASPDRFAPWLSSIVRNRAKRILAGEKTGYLPLDELILQHVPSIATPAIDSADTELIRTSMQDLPDDIRSVLELYYFQDWPVRQISSFLDLPATTVKWKLHVGRNALRNSLADFMEK